MRLGDRNIFIVMVGFHLRGVCCGIWCSRHTQENNVYKNIVRNVTWSSRYREIYTRRVGVKNSFGWLAARSRFTVNKTKYSVAFRSNDKPSLQTWPVGLHNRPHPLSGGTSTKDQKHSLSRATKYVAWESGWDFITFIPYLIIIASI